MLKAARRLAVHDEADADARTNGDVGEVVEPPTGAPTHFGQRRAIHIGVERGRNSSNRLQPSDHVGPSPPRLRRAGNLAVACRLHIEIDGTEARYSECRIAVRCLPVRQELRDCTQRLVRRGGGHSLAGDDIFPDHLPEWPRTSSRPALPLRTRQQPQAALDRGVAAQQLAMNWPCEGSSSTRFLIAPRMRASVRSRSSSDIVSATG